MKDLAGIELQEGDLILDIRTDWEQCKVCRVQGGQTPTGKVRFISWSYFKGNSHEKCILKITPEHAREVLEANKREYINRGGGPDGIQQEYWDIHLEAKHQNFLQSIEQ